MKTTEKKNLLLAELKAHEIADEFVRPWQVHPWLQFLSLELLEQPHS